MVGIDCIQFVVCHLYPPPFLKTDLCGGGCMHTGQKRAMGAFCSSLPVSLRQGLSLSLRLLFFYAGLETGKYLSSLYLCPNRSWDYRQVPDVQLAMWVLESKLESSWFWNMLFLLMGYLSSLYIFHFRWLVCKSRDYNKSISILRQVQVFKYCFYSIIICICAGFIIALLFILWNKYIHT